METATKPTITTNELRVGNYLYTHDKELIERISNINSEYNIVHFESGYSVFLGTPVEGTPVPLTKHLLNRIGFKDSEDYYWHSDFFFLSFWPPTTEGERWAVKVSNDIIITSVQYLHELQNLIHSLTGNELTI